MTETTRTEKLLTQLLLDPTFVKCSCQERATDPKDCKMHGHLFAMRKL